MQPDSQVQPILGSTLLRSSEAHKDASLHPASSGSTFVDEAVLAGGFRYGEVTALSGGPATGKKLITYCAIASHLLQYPQSEVAYVDTTGTFSPVRLCNVLVYQLRAQSERKSLSHRGFMYKKTLEEPRDFLEDAKVMLDRVKIMRVFDIAGLVEALGEVSDTCRLIQQAAPTDQPRLRQEIMDSEDETDSEDQLDGGSVKSGERHVGMFIVNAITNIMSSTVSKSPVQGQAILASFMRSLHHLTAHYQISSILVNAAVNVDKPDRFAQRPRLNENHVSIFSSILGKPALGWTFARMVDLSLYLSSVPKTRSDGALAYGDPAEGRVWSGATVIEVVHDKRGNREGCWAAFDIVADVKMVPCFQ